MKNLLETKIEEQFGKIICTFPVYHHEWEMDGYGFIVEANNKRDVILTNHGTPYVSSLEELTDKIALYKEVIQKTERCIFLLKQGVA